MSYSLPQFLELLFDYCHQNNIDYCFARNYKDLPNEKKRGDLDLVISSGRADDIIQWIKKTPNLTLVNRMQQKDVDNLFIAGVHWGNDYQAIQLDLFSQLTWKGIPFLPIENVLLRSQSVSQEKKQIKKPDPIDEMVISFFSKVINAGMIKEKDWQKWQALCQKKPQAVRDKFKRRMGDFYSNALIDQIERDDQAGVLKNKQRWRFGFIQHQWHQEGLHLPLWLLKHYWSELKTVFHFKKVTRIVFFGVDGAGKTTTIHALKKSLYHMSKGVFVYHVRPPLFKAKQDDPKAVLHNPHGKPDRSAFTSILKLVYFLLLYWGDYLKPRRQPVIHLYDRYFHDMEVDTRRYRYGASKKVLDFFLKLIPKPDLAVLVDIDSQSAQQRKSEVSKQETERQIKDYQTMIKTKFKNYIVVSGQEDTEQNIDKIHENIVQRMGLKKRVK